MVTWGTSPEDGISINETIPNPVDVENKEKEKCDEKVFKLYGFNSWCQNDRYTNTKCLYWVMYKMVVLKI